MLIDWSRIADKAYDKFVEKEGPIDYKEFRRALVLYWDFIKQSIRCGLFPEIRIKYLGSLSVRPHKIYFHWKWLVNHVNGPNPKPYYVENLKYVDQYVRNSKEIKDKYFSGNTPPAVEIPETVSEGYPVNDVREV